jgi:4-amino-4-deoxy-L-arabinose transferase-like glycosyltransferase
MMKIKIKAHINIALVVILAAVFFVATSSFNYFTQSVDYTKWSSPDETANYFFAKRFSEGESLAYFDAAAIVGDNMVMPRSVRSDAGWLKPVSFLGIILMYGEIGSIFGSAVIPFLTPFFADLGIVIFYALIKKIFSDRIALISAFLLATFPVYVYYTVRSMFHNVLFIVLVVTAVYFIVLAAGNRKKKPEEAPEAIKISVYKKFLTFKLDLKIWWQMLAAFISGIFFGLALITRSSEILWLAPAAFVVWLFYAKRLGIIKLILILCGLFLAILPNAYFNQALYSAPIYGGYNEMNRSLDDLSKTGSQMVQSFFSGDNKYGAYLETIYHNIFYFGFNKDQSIGMARHYILEMFPVLLGAFLLGCLIILVLNIRKFQKKYLAYFLAFAIISAILIFYYGSWKFNDNPDPNRFTIGNSYTRYWLPIYLMMMPIAALAITRFSQAIMFSGDHPKRRWKRIIIAGIQSSAVLIISAASILFVLYGSEEGLAYLYYNNLAEKDNAKRVFSLTENNSVIITRYYDKFFFPDRRVIMGTIPDAEMLTAVSKLVNYYPVYYYNFYLKEEDVNYLNERKLLPYELKMSLIKKMNSNFGLYKLEKAVLEIPATNKK